MNHYLMVFERVEGRILQLTPCKDAAEALRARFKAERQHRATPNIEIVVLGAQSEAALRETHARYFENAKELAMSGVKRVDRVVEAAS